MIREKSFALGGGVDTQAAFVQSLADDAVSIDGADYLPVGKPNSYKDYELIYYINDVTIDNEEVLVEYGAAGTATGTYEYDLQRLSVEYVNEAKEYSLYNGTGNVTQTTAENGSMFLRYTYDAFGNISSIRAPMTVDIDDLNRYTYNGEDYDYNTGLQYLRARYYSTGTGNFISQDTYLGDLLNPLSQNRYTYCHNSPVMFNDPSGNFLSWEDIKNFGNDAWDWTKNAAGDIWDWTKQAASDVWTWTKNAYNTVSVFASDCVDIIDECTYADKLINYALQGKKSVACDSVIERYISGEFTLDVASKYLVDICVFDESNTSEQKATESYYFSYYKDTKVIRLYDRSTGFTSCGWSENTILLNSDNHADAYGITTLKHEYGHTVQAEKLGPLYYVTPFLHSLLYFALDGITGNSGWIHDNYYNMPWERSADEYGGVDPRTDPNRMKNYASWSDTVADIYMFGMPILNLVLLGVVFA